MRKVLLYGLVVVVTACASSALAAPLDHFKCYPARSETQIDATVHLRDQFGGQKAEVLATALFCNPVTKVSRDEVTEIGNPAAHLQLYKIRTDGEPMRQRVLVSNQLGRSQPLAVGPAVLLAVPTRKLEHRSELPARGLDHFECYEAEGRPVDAPLALRDQFGFERDLKTVQPRLLCNPAEKRHGERVTKILNPAEHLVCYDLEGTKIDAAATTRNQFGTDKLRLRPAELLCVPSRKRLEEDRPAPGEDVERRREESTTRAEAALATLQCGSPTGDYAITGSESQVSGDEHCFPSNGAGGFGPRADVHELAIVDGMDVADMDGDGDNDFLACDGLSGEVALYTQGPPGVFNPSVVANNVTTGVGGSVFCTNLRVADFNGDGARDFVVGDNRVTNRTFVYLQGPPGVFARVAPGLDVGWASPTGAQCNCLFGVAAGDVDGDANPDVLLLGYRGAGSGEVRFYRGDGLGGMDPPVVKFNLGADFPVVDAPTGIALLDVDQDGDLDVVAGGAADGSHYVYTNDGAGNFAPPAGAAFSIDNYSGLDAYDFDSDGDDDLAVVDWSGRRLLYADGLGGALAAPVPVGNLRGPSIGVGAPELRVRPPQAALDHFKCYPAVQAAPADAEVALRDQFGGGKARVFDNDHFCTPTAKVHEGQFTPIRNDDNHLAFYRIEAETTAPRRPVQVSNQFFREQTLDVGRPVYLAAPAQKLEPKFHQPPRGLDHFQCYEAEGETAGAEVRLRDQFGEEGPVVLEPRLLCNPVEKHHREEVTPVRNPEDHLVCYRLRGTEVTADAYWRTQFGENASPLRPADLLCVPSSKRDPNQDPNITQLCGDRSAVDFDGGMVPPGGPGTGLLALNPDGTWPDGRPRRPCGAYVPVDGFLPSGGVNRFRVAYRRHTDPVPPLGTADGIPTRWELRDRSASPFCSVNPVSPLVLETTGAGEWMDASDYLAAKNGGFLTDFCPNSGLRLAVWDSVNNPPDPDGHYVLWLEWEDTGGVLHKEPFEHHLQLDNTLPTLTDLLVTLEDGTTPVGACGEAPKGEDTFEVYAEFSDDYYWGYRVVVRGGDPPDTVAYGWHDYHDGTPEVVNTDRTGTTPSGSNRFLLDVDMNDLAGFTDCCYLLELFVRDAAIRHSFNNRVANESTSGYWDDVSDFFTFAAAP